IFIAHYFPIHRKKAWCLPRHPQWGGRHFYEESCEKRRGWCGGVHFLNFGGERPGAQARLCPTNRKLGGTMGRIDRKHFRVLLVVVLAVMVLPLLTVRLNNSHAAEKKVLKLGSLTALTLKEGLEIRKWNDLFAKIENEKGGIQVGSEKYQVQFNTYDCGMFDSGKQQPA